jgi:hypothetical protein
MQDKSTRDRLAPGHDTQHRDFFNRLGDILVATGNQVFDAAGSSNVEGFFLNIVITRKVCGLTWLVPDQDDGVMYYAGYDPNVGAPDPKTIRWQQS